jgi:two-component system chemotaxis sensor kinase CheA
VDIQRLDNLMNLAGELVVNKARFVQIARQMGPAFKKSSLSSRARGFGESMRRAIEMMKQHARGRDDAEVMWAEQLHDLEAELDVLEEQSRHWEQSRRGFTQITEAIDQMARVSDSLQRGVLDTRMVPVAPLFNRFKRTVRDIALELGKRVQLEIRGETTELDKRLIDELGDPLVHLVRNAIDHGIEPADVRARRGKPETGTLTLEAMHSGNNVLITVRDDGGGIYVDKVRQKIVDRDLLPADAAAQLSDAEVTEYIWHPGFSTADSVSDISGRGVGMDIVKTRIAELNGTIEVQHAPGRGTTFTIRLPLTLAIIRSLLFRVRYGVFAVPIDNVREIVSVPVEDVLAVHGRQTFDVRGTFIPLVGIDDLFEWHGGNAELEADEADGEVARRKRINVVILHSADQSIGLCVDELHGGQEIVIKSLAENFVHIRGLSGASILGDGSVCLLLDAGAVVALAADARRQRPRRSLATAS